MSDEAFIKAQTRVLEHYGVATTSRFIATDVVDGRAHVLESGDGPPVVMVNGIGTPAAMWAPLIAQLDGFRFLGVDLPGFGLTDSSPEFAEDVRHNSVRLLTEVLDGLALQRPAFIANSLGSLCTSWLALDQSSRVGAMVHVGCPALLLGTSAPLPMRLLSAPALGRVINRVDPPSPRQVVRLSKMVHEHPLTPELAAVLLATEEREEFEPAFLATLHTLVRLRGARPGMGLTADQLTQIEQPVQLIWGDDDPFGSTIVGRRAADELPHAEFHVAPGGHAPWLGSAERIASIVEPFLRDHSRVLVAVARP